MGYSKGFERLSSHQDVMEMSLQGGSEIFINIKIKTGVSNNNHMHIRTCLLHLCCLTDPFLVPVSVSVSIFLSTDGGSCVG